MTLGSDDEDRMVVDEGLTAIPEGVTPPNLR